MFLNRQEEDGKNDLVKIVTQACLDNYMMLIIIPMPQTEDVITSTG